MKYWKWIWLTLAIVSLSFAAWGIATPYTMKASDPLQKIVIITGLEVLSGVFGIFSLFRFVKLVKAHKRQRTIVNNFLKD
ncbi:MAG TPA: hypothetical protein VFP97_13435 [Chitinophagaceae bacterium]|jgi:hypothetical protein|nr:hypothetical protein [Chitinophagaceae bacterium]